jgi:hypothetical protein
MRQGDANAKEREFVAARPPIGATPSGHSSRIGAKVALASKVNRPGSVILACNVLKGPVRSIRVHA